MIKKIMIANRGEIACRIIRACKSLNIKTVCIYTESDEFSLHTILADESFKIGPCSVNKSYANIESIITIAVASNCDAIHPGYGFLSEDPNFPRLCEDNGLIFIGPSKETMTLLGNKKNAKNFVNSLNIQTVPGFEYLNNMDELTLREKAEHLGFPLIIKSTTNGGGKGMKVCNSFNELISNININKNEAQKSHMQSQMIIEKYIELFRHIEIQILADSYHHILHVGSRDCTIQYNMQKMIEEAPSNNPKIDQMIKDSLLIAKNSNYTSLGTIEFMYDIEKQDYYFLEVNPRVQVEHTVTEMITNIELIEEQIKIANGGCLSVKQEDIHIDGHSIECRINAQDVCNNLNPNFGIIKEFHFPIGNNVRIESHIITGTKITPYYDSMIAKIVVKDKNRENAINKMLNSLDEFYCAGIRTNLTILIKLLTDDEFKKNNINNQYFNKIYKNLNF